MIAHKQYYAAPSDETRHELDEAQRLDRRDILIFEVIMAAILGAVTYGFICVERKIEGSAT